MPSNPTLWFVFAGALLILMALAKTLLKRLPVSSAVLYLLVGLGIGPYGLDLLDIDLVKHAHTIEILSEVAILVSLFTAGLNLAPPLTDKRWQIPIRLAGPSMILTIGLLTLIGVYLLHLPLGAAVLMGALFAPTDPVLASDVTVEHHEDRDRLRFGLTGEAGINDGGSFPFIMLGLGLMGLHSLGPGGIRWFGIDVVWAIVAGVGSGFGMGFLIANLVLYLRKTHKEAVGLEEFLTLGLIALTNGVALFLHSYGFLAVFAAGLALRRIEQHEALRVAALQEGREDEPDTPEEAATDEKHAPAYLAHTLLTFNERLEHIGEMVLMVLVGSLIRFSELPLVALWFIPLLFLVVRPLSVQLCLKGSRATRTQRGLMAWFGIRGIGSIYYLAYAIEHGIPEPLARDLIALVLAVVTASVFFHGISVTPLMSRYNEKRKERKEAEQAAQQLPST